MKTTSYCCKPQKKTGPAMVLCVVSLALAVILFYLSNLFEAIRAAGQLISVLLLLLFVQITTKFLLCEYCYHYEEESLKITTMQGKRIKTLGTIPISPEAHLFYKEEWKEKKNDFSIQNRFSYCQNLFPEKEFVLLVPGEKGYLLLCFEPDETLVSVLKEQMKKSEKGESF